MEIISEEQQNIKVMKLIGDLDNSTADQARSGIMAEITANTQMVLDMAKCQYVSSAGLRVLMIVAKKIKAVGGQAVLANMVEEVEDVMEMTGFGHMLESFSSTGEAIAYLKEEGGE